MENTTFTTTTSYFITSSIIKGVGKFFYLVDPAQTTFAFTEDVSEFYNQSWPYFLAFIFLENVILFWEGKPTIRINDGITSLSHGIIHQSGKLVFRGAESVFYIYIYDKWRMIELDWASPITWYLAAIGVDFCYYWVHRASHEIHILWAQHQVHHSSEEYNLAVGLRQSFVYSWCGFVFYLPLALIIPPAHFLTHQQFSLLYQFWLHTETVKNLGPLEWIFNTPRHHRVHHGSNIFCLDKNYGGVLIIWDRMFGTFAPPRKGEEIIYGLVVNQPSFNPLWLQTFYTKYVWQKVQSMEGWKNKIYAVIKGPSWTPGSPWTGREEDKIVVTKREKYDVHLPLWCNIYLLIHFAIVVLAFQELTVQHMGMSQMTVIGFVSYILCSLTSVGLMLDNQPQARAFETSRCIILAILVAKGILSPLPSIFAPFLQLFFISSAVFCMSKSMEVVEKS